jgi:uncharacterized protein YpuA (DUF1002 family)
MRFAVFFLVSAVTVGSAFAKAKYVDYPVRANSATVTAELLRYFTQMGYAQDLQHTKQCDDHPTEGMLSFRQTGPAQSGIDGLSRCVAVSVTSSESGCTMRVEVSDHLRGGLTLPATKHYGDKFIRANYETAFKEIVIASENSTQP